MTARIKVLSADIASKIAAGEVVERPASVLKELLENSIDAGATQIEINILGGGIREITVQDNGHGIVSEDLALAVQQHATSKINSVQDLASINSLGFRGEALASINSVARLSLTSHTAQQQHAWRWFDQQLMPAAHPIGTTICVQDLFYNLPARRKFLRSERTEYLYLEEIFRRIALSALHVGFSFNNNGKIVKTLPSCVSSVADEGIINPSKSKRVATLCGKSALATAITIDGEQNGMRLWGWLGNPHTAAAHETHQYFFINGRIIKDRLINHAIREVYQNLYTIGFTPFYCLYLELDPVVLDVNVHPTKHEVRFREPRIIHAFLTETLTAALDAIPELQHKSTAQSNFLPKSLTVAQPSLTPTWQVLSIIGEYMIVVQHVDRLIIVHGYNLIRAQKLQELLQDCAPANLDKPLLLTTSKSIAANTTFLEWLSNFGFNIAAWGAMQLAVRAIPRCLLTTELNYITLLDTLYLAWERQTMSKECFMHIVEAIILTEPIQLSLANRLLAQTAWHANAGVWCEWTVSDLAKFFGSMAN